MRTAIILGLIAGEVYGLSARQPYVSVPIALVLMLVLLRDIKREAEREEVRR
jgi:hypothetical protein